MSEPCYADIPLSSAQLIALMAGNAPVRTAAAISSGAITTQLSGALIHEVTLDANITTWNVPLPSGGDTAVYAYYTTVDFLPPASGGPFSVTVPDAWDQYGPLATITLSAGAKPIRCVLATRGTTITYTAVQGI
jgi:hypothetical protein